MLVLGIDPGFERVGIALVEKKKNQKEVVVFSECFSTSKDVPFSERLGHVGSHLRELIVQYKPDALAIEKLYFTTNKKTALSVAEARGVLVYEGTRGGLPIYEYTPPEIKVAVTGYGKADKEHIMAMVPKLITRKQDHSMRDDEVDAIAVALTAIACEKW